ELVQTLSHPGGWWRDTAQRLLVEQNAVSVAPQLKELARSSASMLARLHALWTLEGLHQIDPEIIATALADKEPKIRAAAIRIAEPLLKATNGAALRQKIFASASDPGAEVQTQLALSLSQLAPDISARQTL